MFDLNVSSILQSRLTFLKERLHFLTSLSLQTVFNHTAQNSSQILVHVKAAPATAGFRGTWWQRRKQRLGHPVGRQRAPVVHENVSQTHVGVERWGGGVVELGEAQAAQVHGAADGDSRRGVWGGRGEERGWKRLSDGCRAHNEDVLGGGCSWEERLAALRDRLLLMLLLQQRGVGAQAREAAGGGDAVGPSLHL